MKHEVAVHPQVTRVNDRRLSQNQRRNSILLLLLEPSINSAADTVESREPRCFRAHVTSKGSHFRFQPLRARMSLEAVKYCCQAGQKLTIIKKRVYFCYCTTDATLCPWAMQEVSKMVVETIVSKLGLTQAIGKESSFKCTQSIIMESYIDARNWSAHNPAHMRSVLKWKIHFSVTNWPHMANYHWGIQACSKSSGPQHCVSQHWQRPQVTTLCKMPRQDSYRIICYQACKCQAQPDY